MIKIGYTQATMQTFDITDFRDIIPIYDSVGYGLVMSRAGEPIAEIYGSRKIRLELNFELVDISIFNSILNYCLPQNLGKAWVEITENSLVYSKESVIEMKNITYRLAGRSCDFTLVIYESNT
jgi:hypothetical protein